LVPSPAYDKIIEKMVDYYKSDSRVFAVVLFGSLARGQGVPGSNIDLVVFVYPKDFKSFFKIENTHKRVDDYIKMGGKPNYYLGATCGPRTGQETEYSIDFNDIRVNLMFRDDIPRLRDQVGICVDHFELDIGNYFVYCLPLYERDDTYKSLARKYLPYYGDDIRKERLEATRKEFDYRIERAKKMAERGLVFNSISQLYISFAILLQHLFIRKRKYPIYYRKWIKSQIVDILHEPELYEQLLQIYAIPKLTSEILKAKADLLHNIMQKYCQKIKAED